MTPSPPFVRVGGTHGHVEEELQGDIVALWKFCEWKPIRNCTGRYTCRETSAQRQQFAKNGMALPSSLPPLTLMTSAFQSYGNFQDVEIPPYWKVYEFGPAPGRTDPILVLPLNPEQTVGIITLNAPSGFQRKLQAVGIKLEPQASNG